MGNLHQEIKVIDLVESPLNLNSQPMSRNYLQPRGGTAIIGSTPRLQVNLDKSQQPIYHDLPKRKKQMQKILGADDGAGPTETKVTRRNSEESGEDNLVNLYGPNGTGASEIGNSYQN